MHILICQKDEDLIGILTSNLACQKPKKIDQKCTLQMILLKCTYLRPYLFASPA